MPKTPEPRYAPSLGDADIAEARRALLTGNTRPASALLTTRPTGMVPFLIMALTDPVDLNARAHESIDQLDGDLLLGAGAAMRHWWEVTILEREDGAIQPSVYRHAVQGAHALARTRGSELPPWFPTIALAVEIDLGHSLDQRAARFETIVSKEPEDALAWFMQLRSMRYEEAVARIDGAASDAKPGSVLHALRVVPHIEHWRQSEESARGMVFSQPDVVRAVSEASSAFVAGRPEPPYALFGHGLLAFTTFRLPNSTLARTHLEAMAARWTFWPWGFLRRPAAAMLEVIEQHRKSFFRLR